MLLMSVVESLSTGIVSTRSFQTLVDGKIWQFGAPGGATEAPAAMAVVTGTDRTTASARASRRNGIVLTPPSSRTRARPATLAYGSTGQVRTGVAAAPKRPD